MAISPSGIPDNVEVQRSPNFTGIARVKVPVVTMSPTASGGFALSFASRADKMPQRRQRSIQYVTRVAMLDDIAAGQLRLEGG